MTAAPMNRLLLAGLWPVMKDRLDTATMRSICNTSGASPSPCVYVSGIDDFSEPEGDESEDWGRVVIVPTQTLWPVAEVEGQTRKVGFLIRTEFNNLSAVGYNPFVGLELSQQEGYDRLQRWTPGAIDGVLVAFGLYRNEAPQPIPQRDDDRGLVWLSSSYRLEVSGPPA